MRYAILCYDSEAVIGGCSAPPAHAVLARLSAASDRIQAQARLSSCLRPMPTTAAVTMRAARVPLMLDGPFANTKEQLLEVWLPDCATLDRALEAPRELVRQKDSGAFEVGPIHPCLPPGVPGSRAA